MVSSMGKRKVTEPSRGTVVQDTESRWKSERESARVRVRVREGNTKQGWTIQEQFGFGVRHEVSRHVIGGARRGALFFPYLMYR